MRLAQENSVYPVDVGCDLVTNYGIYFNISYMTASQLLDYFPNWIKRPLRIDCFLFFHIIFQNVSYMQSTQ